MWSTKDCLTKEVSKKKKRILFLWLWTPTPQFPVRILIVSSHLDMYIFLTPGMQTVKVSIFLKNSLDTMPFLNSWYHNTGFLILLGILLLNYLNFLFLSFPMKILMFHFFFLFFLNVLFFLLYSRSLVSRLLHCPDLRYPMWRSQLCVALTIQIWIYWNQIPAL